MHSEDGFKEWQDHLETETRSVSRLDAGRADLVVPALTVLSHPDPRRVGESASLAELRNGTAARLSRLEPLFVAPEGDEPRPLADPRLSRRPIHLDPLPERGIRLETLATKTTVEVAGKPLAGSLDFSADQIEQGIVLVLGERIALLLHHTEPVTERPPAFDLVGESSAMARVRWEIWRVARFDIPVLVCGESGTGKELVARAVHTASRRRDHPYLSLNIAAVPPTLAAAELFGVERGAFSGADRKRQGYFQRASGGTLFLDEIGETPPEVQVLLLRALETGEIQPVGADQSQRVDVRIIAATDADLESASEAGTFKAPLLHRLCGYRITIPPLRSRREDIGRLFFHFLHRELAELGEAERLVNPGPHGHPWVPARLVAQLATGSWPGNVRQLLNATRQLVVGSRGSKSLELGEELAGSLQALPAPESPATAEAPSLPLAAKSLVPKDQPPTRARPEDPVVVYREPSDIGEEELLEALKRFSFRLKPTAEALQISRTSLYKLIDQCPRIRKASDLQGPDIELAAERWGGQLDSMAAALEVSKQGLKLRMKELGLR